MPPRVSLGTFPTPLDPLPNLSRELGFEILMKRDDQTGLALGGNKIRKLEMLMAEAVAAGADAVVTCGSAQSNHCRCTAAAAARLGLECGLVLFEGRHNGNGNLLLDGLFGATVELHPAADRRRADELMSVLGQRYQRPWVIPFGGSNAVGAAAYVWGYQELVEQLGGRGGTVLCVTSSGATHAGLALGAAITGGPTVTGVAIGDSARDCVDRLGLLIGETARLIDEPVNPEPRVIDGFQGGGYGVPSPAGIAAIRAVARAEGILLDPVYTAKAMAALIARGSELEPPLIFLHSGGVPALFAYAADL
ncbi:MAG: D-cysteine desulfhydrase [Candidatus Dormibacteraceae bacterium]